MEIGAEMATAARKATNIKARRRLHDLFERGKLVRFNVTEDGDMILDGDEQETDEKIWICPPSQMQREQALREAQATRARESLRIQDPESDEYKVAKDWVEDQERKSLEEYVLSLGDADRRQAAIRLVLSGDDWKEFDALTDAMRQWEEAGNPDTEEWAPLIAKDKAFGEQLDEAFKSVLESDKEAIGLISTDELQKRSLKRRKEILTTQAFVDVYEKYMTYFSCRDADDHRTLYFGSPEELYELPEEVLDVLRGSMAEFIQEATEAKN
jgi:predicted RNA-binding protein YlxR (DUF448 family)